MRRLLVFLVTLLVACSLTALPKPKLAQQGPGEVVPWEGHFRSVAGSNWIERAAQVQAESGWNQYAKSNVGAMGPAQVMPNTLKWWKSMGWVPAQATGYDIPAAFVGQNGHMLWLRRYWPDLDRRLAAYNAGQGSILRAQARADEIGYEGADDWLYRALPRITGKANAAQTQGYIKHNAAYRAAITKKLGGRK